MHWRSSGGRVGERRAGSGASHRGLAQARVPCKFADKEEDVEVGLAYFGARYLSLGLGRWMSADPATIHGVRGDPNPYAYVAGRTMVAVDPNGEFILEAILIGAAIGALISSTAYVSSHGFHTKSGGWWEGLGVAAGLGALTGAALGAMTVAGFPQAAVGAYSAGASWTSLGAAATYGAGIGVDASLTVAAAGRANTASDLVDQCLRGLEGGALAGAGSPLGYQAGLIYPIIGGEGTAIALAATAGINGALGGYRLAGQGIDERPAHLRLGKPDSQRAHRLLSRLDLGSAGDSRWAGLSWLERGHGG